MLLGLQETDSRASMAPRKWGEGRAFLADALWKACYDACLQVTLQNREASPGSGSIHLSLSLPSPPPSTTDDKAQERGEQQGEPRGPKQVRGRMED